MAPIISIIIPVLNEQDTLRSTLSSLAALEGFEHAEVLVVDGDPNGSSVYDIPSEKMIALISPKGRGIQMNAGAEKAAGEILLFLHADTRLPDNALLRILESRTDKALAGGAFDLGIVAAHPFFRVIEKTASLRSRMTRLPYGDQALFIRRNWFAIIGGFKPIPVMEDLDLMKRLKQAGGRIQIFPDRVGTSARRWEKEGMLSCTLRNWMLLCLYHAGVSPEKLAALYP
jgi:rSAM/selenodomain-associated transferase 2